MNRARTGLLVGIVSAIGVLLLAISASERKSPGRVSTVHGRIAEIEGGEACAACHGGWFGHMRGACSDCHEDVAAQITDQRGLHGRLSPELVTDCATCHSEHHGDDFQLVNPLAFSLAGVPDPAQFDHSLVGFVMDGVHLTLACKQCHTNADATVLPEGGKRFLGLQRDCASCHDDPHGGRMQVGCAVCHDQTSFQDHFVPEHENWLSLLGAHADVGCRACHQNDSEHALESMRPDGHRSARTCGDCHETPHSERFLAGNGGALGQAPQASCSECHPLDLPTFADPRVAVTPEQHAFGGFPLAAPHDQVACAACHTPGVDYAGRHPGRGPRECHACHEDPHGGQFAPETYPGGCVDCHAATHFAPTAFDRQHHERTALPLEGRHSEIECQECHTDPGDDGARMFHGTPRRCEQCHADAHASGFVASHPNLAKNERGTCATCHRTDTFGSVATELFDHGLWTGFPITGAHAQVDCAACHRPMEQPDQTGRRFGRIERHGAGFAGCVTCHTDVHEGLFDGEQAPTAVGGRHGCERCHDTASFRALPYGFEHGTFTGWPLAGAHSRLDCSACHERLAQPSDVGRSWGRARGRDCVDCHTDPHQGQFERLGSTDCSRCHKSATTFATLSFRHNLDSSFPLGEAHEKVACAGCHKPEPIRGVTAVRYRPLPMECVDCHGTEGGGSTGRRRRQ